MLQNHLLTRARFQGGGGGLGSSIGGLVGGIAVLGGAAGKGGKKEHKQALEIWKQLQTSNFDFSSLSPPELQILAEQTPELYQAVVPEEFKQIATGATRANQLTSLAQLEQIGREGLPTEDRLAAQQAAQAVTSAAGASRADALRALAARGQLNSGDEIQAQLAGNQQAANLAANLGTNLAREAAMRRMSGIQAAGQEAGAIRSADESTAAQNAAIANRYAELFSGLKTQEAQQNAAARQAAQNYNVQTRQQTGNANVANAYGTQLENLNRQNALRSQQFTQNLAKTQGLSGAYNALAAYKDALQQQKAQAIQNTGSGAGGAIGSIAGGI